MCLTTKKYLITQNRVRQSRKIKEDPRGGRGRANENSSRRQNKKEKAYNQYHDSKWTGHPGIHRTLALVGNSYY